MTTLSISSPLVAPAGVDQPLEIPARVESHPLRWRKVLRLLRDIRKSEDPVQAGLELFDAVGGLGGEKTFQRFRRRPEGRRLLRERPDLVGLLGDREILNAMPEGSLGRAYLDFAERNGFAADGLVEKNKSFERESDSKDIYRGWFWDRYTMSHDLWHVMTGSETTPDGEARLLAFSFGHTPQRGYLILLGLIAFGHALDFGYHRRQWAAWRAGRRAHDLVSVPWESLLAWPLDEVRACYGVEELAQ
jgi:ubiquinone biosynthesis protein COQ4